MTHPPAPETPENPAISSPAGGADQPQQPPQPQYGSPQQPIYAPPPSYAQQPPPVYAAPPVYAPPPTYVPPPAYAQQAAYAPQPSYSYPAGYALPAPGPGEPFDGAFHAGELNRPLYGASLGQAFTRFFKNYANFTGRASRSEYWWMVLVLFLAYFGLALAGGLLASAMEYASPPGASAADSLGGLVALVFLAALLGAIIPTLALTWRRLHDANLAGPMYFLTFVPYVGSLVVFVFTLLSPKPAGRRFDQIGR